MCTLGHLSFQVKSWGQPPGLLQGLSPMEEKCLYPQGPERCCPSLSGMGQVAEQLLFCCHLFGAQPPVGVPVLPAAGMWHTAAGAVEESGQKGKQWSCNCKLDWPTAWDEGASLAELWGQITQQLWQTPKTSCGGEEQDASCLAAGVPCPAAVPSHRPVSFCFSLVVTYKHVEGGQAYLVRSDDTRRNLF